MTSFEGWLAILAYTVPMIASPGPGNTMLAASGAKFGIGRSVPFWLGFEAGNIAWCLAYGFGLAELVSEMPSLHSAMRWAGTAYLLYLAFGFFRAGGTPAESDVVPLGFHDGLVALSLNPKVHSMIVVMFTLFLDRTQRLPSQVVQMTMAFAAVGVAAHYLWLKAGQVILGRLRSATALRVQNYVFGTCMLGVAAMMARA